MGRDRDRLTFWPTDDPAAFIYRPGWDADMIFLIVTPAPGRVFAALMQVVQRFLELTCNSLWYCFFFSLPQLVFILSPCSCKYFEQCFTFCHSLSVWWWMMMMMDFFVFMSCTSSTQPLLVYKTPKMQLQRLSNSLHYISLENDKLFCSINFNKVFCPLSCAWHRKSAPKEALSSKSQLKFFS